jgi:hypothetical protein
MVVRREPFSGRGPGKRRGDQLQHRVGVGVDAGAGVLARQVVPIARRDGATVRLWIVWPSAKPPATKRIAPSRWVTQRVLKWGLR